MKIFYLSRSRCASWTCPYSVSSGRSMRVCRNTNTSYRRPTTAPRPTPSAPPTAWTTPTTPISSRVLTKLRSKMTSSCRKMPRMIWRVTSMRTSPWCTRRHPRADLRKPRRATSTQTLHSVLLTGIIAYRDTDIRGKTPRTIKSHTSDT